MLEESGFDLGGGQTVARHVDDIVNTAPNPVVTIVVTTSAISGELSQSVSHYYKSSWQCPYVVSLVHIQVGVHVPLVGTPNGAGHARPGLLERENALHIVAQNLLSGDRVDDGRLDTEEGQRSTAGLGGGNTAKGSDDVGASLSLPVGLDESKLADPTFQNSRGLQNERRKCALPPCRPLQSTTSTPLQQLALQQSQGYEGYASCGECVHLRRA